MSKAIKPCPFCDKHPELREIFGIATIECQNSNCNIKPSTWLGNRTKSFDKVIRIWNKRKGE